MMNRIDRRKRNPGMWSRVALVSCVWLLNLRIAAARTWEVLVQPATYILLDHDMIRQIPEGDPVFTQTQLGTDAPTPMPVPTPSPVPLPTSAPSNIPSLRPTTTASPTITPAPVAPTISPQPTAYVSYPPGQEPTAAPTPIYRNSDIDSLCKQSEKVFEIHMQDTFGDGWEGRNLTITVAESPHVLSKVTETQIGNSTVIKYKTTTLNGTDVYYYAGHVVWTGTLYGGDIGFSYSCIRPGVCYEAYMPGGAWAEEILWEIKQPTFNVTPADNYAGIVIAKGGAPSRCLFSIPDPVTGLTYCPTTCNRFPLDPTPYPSAAPSSSLMPSGEPSSNAPSEMPSLFPSEEPSQEPSLEPSLEPSGEPSESPSKGPSAMPVSVSQRYPPTNVFTPPPTVGNPTPPVNPPTAPANSPTVRPPTLVDVNDSPQTSDNVAKRYTPTLRPTPAPALNSPTAPPPTLVDLNDSPQTADNVAMPDPELTPATVPQPNSGGRRRRRSYQPSPRPPTTSSSVQTTVTPPTRSPTNGAQTDGSTGSTYNRPYITGGGNTQTGGQTQYRHYTGNNNNARPPPTAAPAAQPTAAPGASPTAPKEVLDISHLGNGV
jgi:hypothetical protein